jgi:hypothetical protein
MQAISDPDTGSGIYTTEYCGVQDMCFQHQDDFFAPVIADYSPFFKHGYTNIIKVVEAQLVYNG